MSVGVVRKRLRMELARCEHIQRRENAIAVSNSGTVKAHLALRLGQAAAQLAPEVIHNGAHRQRCPILLL